MKARIFAAALVFALGAGAIAYAVYADARGARLQALLSEIETAEERVPHSGTRVLGGPDWSVTLKVASEEGRSRAELVEFSGGGRPARRPLAARVPYLANIPEFLKPGRGQWKRKIKDYGLALRNYEIEPAGRQTVAGREADLLEVRARHPGRPSYRVAADAANRFPLRFEAFSEGRRVFLAEFREIEYAASVPVGAPPGGRRPSWLKIERDEVPFHEAAARVDYGIWAPDRLPAGFELRRSALVRVAVDFPEEARRGMERLPFVVPKLDARVAHFDYTDGIAVLSLVECPANSELWRLVRAFLGAGAKGEGEGKVVVRRFADAGGAALFLEIGDTAILAAGNVAAGEIEEMIRTLRRR